MKYSIDISQVPFYLWCHLVLGFLCLFFCLDDLSIGDTGVLQSLTTTVLEYICAFKSVSVCLIKLGALTLGAYRLITYFVLVYFPFY
jgi:hypothetical protein